MAVLIKNEILNGLSCINKIRILVVSNYYPPLVYGGYEIGCGQVVKGLRERGVNVQVLTSSRVPKKGRSYVHSELHDTIQADFSKMNPLQKFVFLIRHEAANLQAFRRILSHHRPDVLYFWNVSHTSGSLVLEAKRIGIRTGYFAFDHALAGQDTDAWNSQFLRISGKATRSMQRLVMKAAGFLMGHPGVKLAKFDFIHYPTEYLAKYLKKRGVEATSWQKILWGVDTEKFHPAPSLPAGRLLYVGQVAKHKGVHLALEALGLLNQRSPELDWSLTIAGRCLDPKYQAKLDELVARFDLGRRVRFTGFMTRENLPELYRQHSILLFPSIWDEPMGISILEAMASGLCVISSGTGGSGELYTDKISALTCEGADTETWFKKLRSLLTRLDSIRIMSKKAREKTIKENHISKTVETILHSLKKINSR